MIDENKKNNENIGEFNLFDLGKSLITTNIKEKTEERNLIILGEKCSGKTTIMNLFIPKQLDKKADSSYKSTCGINYNYLRYQPGSKKFLLNIYEIGGGINNLNLLTTLINDKNIKNSMILLLIDLSNPSKILENLNTWINTIGSIINEKISQSLIQDIIDTKKIRYEKQNIDSKNFLPIEISLLFTKYEKFETLDLEKIKWACRTFRFFSHFHGLSLIFIKLAHAKQMKLFQSHINNFAFSTGSELNFTQKDHIQPLFIIYGKDSIESIGDPKVMEKNSTMKSLWESTFKTVFPKIVDDKEKGNEVEEIIKMKFNEPRIDAELYNFERKYEIFNKSFNSKTEGNIGSPENSSPTKVVDTKSVIKEVRYNAFNKEKKIKFLKNNI